MNTRIDPPDDQRHCNIAQSIVPGDANFRTGAERQPGQFRLRLSIHRTTKDLPDAGWSSGIRGCIEYQPRPPKPVSEIAIRDRSRTRCEWGQNWGHNLIFSGCNYRSRAKSKCFLATRTAYKATAPPGITPNSSLRSEQIAIPREPAHRWRSALGLESRPGARCSASFFCSCLNCCCQRASASAPSDACTAIGTDTIIPKSVQIRSCFISSHLRCFS